MNDVVRLAAAECLSLELLRDITDFYNAYARVLDTRHMQQWKEFFTDDGVYSLTTFRNASGKGMYLIYEKGQDAITRRAAVASGYLQAQRTKTLHLISNIAARRIDQSTVAVDAYFATFRTARDRTSQFHACGEFHDLIRVQGKLLRLVEHNVVFDAENLPSNMADIY